MKHFASSLDQLPEIECCKSTPGIALQTRSSNSIALPPKGERGSNNVSRRAAGMALSGCATVLAGLFLLTVGALAAEQPGRPDSAGQSAGGSNDNGSRL